VADRGYISQNSVVLKPDVGSAYSHGWQQMWKYFVELLLIVIINILIGIPSGFGVWIGKQVMVNIFGVFGFIYNILLLGPVYYGVSFACLKAARGDKVEIQDMFEAFKNYWNVVLANILVSAIVVIGFMLCIIPGIIFACKLAFTPYLVVDRKMEVTEAIKTSWNMTNGHALTVFLIGLLAIPICIAGLICFLVGIIPAIMWISLALASLYHSVSISGEVAA
jgi:uncharacterized membrane protein